MPKITSGQRNILRVDIRDVRVAGLLLTVMLGLYPGRGGLFSQSGLHIFFSGGLHGAVRSEAPARQGDVLRLGAAVRGVLAEHDLSADDILLFDTGDALAYHYLSQLDSGHTVFRQMLGAGYHGMIPSDFEFKYGVDNLRTLAGLDSTFALLSTNIYRDDSTHLFAPYRIFRRQGLTVGVVGVVEQAVAGQLILDQRKNVRITDPEKALREVVSKIRPRCDLIIAVNHMRMDDNLQLCRRVAGLDIVIGRPAGDSLRYLRVYSDEGRPRSVIVSAPANATAIGHLFVDTRPGALATDPDAVAFREAVRLDSVPFDTLDLGPYHRLDSIFRRYVAEKYNGQPPERWLVKAEPGQRQSLMNYALYALLRSTHSEVAILNYGALVSPLADRPKGHLNIRDIESMARPDDPVVTMRLTGRSINAILNRARQFSSGANAALRVMAVGDYRQGVGRTLTPHGIKLDDNQVYAVATIQFLAEGGDGYDEFRKGTHRRRRFSFTGATRLLASEEPGAHPVPLSDLLIHHLLAGVHPDFTDDQPFYRRDPFLNRPLWMLKFENIDFSYKSVRVSNNEGFSNAADKRVAASTQNATNIAASGYLAGLRRTSRTRWENGALIRYALQQIGANEIQESDDRLELQTILDWDDPFNMFENPGQFNLYSSLRYDTEFTAPEDAEGQPLPRRKDGYFYLGVSRFGKANREMRLAFFAKNNFVNNRRDAGFELNAKYFRAFRWFRHGSLLRGRFLFNQPDRRPGDERALLDYTGFLEFNLIDFITLKPQVNVFLFQDMGLKNTASNLQFSVALSFSRLWKPQYIRFWRQDKG